MSGSPVRWESRLRWMHCRRLRNGCVCPNGRRGSGLRLALALRRPVVGRDNSNAAACERPDRSRFPRPPPPANRAPSSLGRPRTSVRAGGLRRVGARSIVGAARAQFRSGRPPSARSAFAATLGLGQPLTHGHERRRVLFPNPGLSSGTGNGIPSAGRGGVVDRRRTRTTGTESSGAARTRMQRIDPLAQLGQRRDSQGGRHHGHE